MDCSVLCQLFIYNCASQMNIAPCFFFRFYKLCYIHYIKKIFKCFQLECKSKNLYKDNLIFYNLKIKTICWSELSDISNVCPTLNSKICRDGRHIKQLSFLTVCLYTYKFEHKSFLSGLVGVSNFIKHIPINYTSLYIFIKTQWELTFVSLHLLSFHSPSWTKLLQVRSKTAVA